MQDFGALTVDQVLRAAALRPGQHHRGDPVALIDLAVIDLRFLALCRVHEVLPPMRSGQGRPGRPSDYPPLMRLHYFCLLRIYGSSPRADCELRQPLHWHALRSTYWGLFAVDLGPEPIQWGHARYYADRYLREEALNWLTVAMAPYAVGLANALGLLLPGAEPRWEAPSLSNIIGVDGTYVRPNSEAHLAKLSGDGGEAVLVPVHSRATRPERVRVQHEKHLGRKDGRYVSGLLYVAVTVRHPRRPNTRVILLVYVAPAQQGENRATMHVLDHLLPFTRGAQALVVDGILHGVEFDVLIRKYGVLCISPQPGYSGPRDGLVPPGPDPGQYLGFRTLTKGAETTVKRTLVWELDPLQEHLQATGHDHRLAFDDGVLYDVYPDPKHPAWLRKGPRHLPVHVQRLHTPQAGYWFRATFALTCPDGPLELVLDLPTHPVHGKRPNQYVRLVPEIGRRADQVRGDRPEDRYARRYPLREDLEALWSWYKHRLPFGRANAITRRRQTLDFFAAALVSNAITWWHAGGPDVDPA